MKKLIASCSLFLILIAVACQRDEVEITSPTSLPTPTQQVSVVSTAVPTPRLLVDFWNVPAQTLTIQGNRAYVAAGEDGLHIFDMSNPEMPTAVASFDIETWDVLIYEDKLYAVGCQKQCVCTISLSGRQPELMEEIFYTYRINPVVVMTIESGMMYLALEGGLVEVVDMQQRPWQILHTQQIPDEIADLDSRYDFLYVTTQEGIYLFDVAEPTAWREQDFYLAPKPKWHEETPGTVYETVVDGESIYVAADSKGLRVLQHSPDYEDRQMIDFWGDYFYHVRGRATAVNWQEPLIYIKSWDVETGQYYLTVLRQFEQTAIYTPLNLIGEYTIGKDDPGQMVVWNGRVYFIDEGITRFYLPSGYEELTGTHPISPSVTGPPSSEVEFVRQIGGDKFSLGVQGNIAYVGLDKTLHIYDVVDPANPVKVDTLHFDYAIVEIKIHNGHAYLRMARFEWDDLLVLDISDPLNPREFIPRQ